MSRICVSQASKRHSTISCVEQTEWTPAQATIGVVQGIRKPMAPRLSRPIKQIKRLVSNVVNAVLLRHSLAPRVVAFAFAFRVQAK
jgi:hypothetical protein